MKTWYMRRLKCEGSEVVKTFTLIVLISARRRQTDGQTYGISPALRQLDKELTAVYVRPS